MKTTLYFSAILASLVLFGCKPKETTLSGQLFIVTRSAENIKLGLVEVQLIEKQQVLDFLKKKQAAIDLEIAYRKKEYASASDALKPLQDLDEDLFKLKYETSANADAKQKEAEVLLKKLQAIVNDAEEQGKPLADILKNKLDVARIRYDSATLKINEPYPKAETYFNDIFAIVIQKTTTDADGRFSISYPRKNPFALFAEAHRMVGDKTENYFWLINAPSGAETAQILLSNNNLVFSDPDGYFKIKPQPDEQTKPTP